MAGRSSGKAAGLEQVRVPRIRAEGLASMPLPLLRDPWHPGLVVHRRLAGALLIMVCMVSGYFARATSSGAGEKATRTSRIERALRVRIIGEDLGAHDVHR
jgi:hypothetical protein